MDFSTEETKVISQKTFDSAVQENVVNFEMDKEDALKHAVEQFTKQGVNLNMIIKSTVADGEDHEVLMLSRQLEGLMKESVVQGDKVKELMDKLRVEFKKDLSYRYQAHKVASVEKVIFDACVHLRNEKSNTFKASLQTLAALITGQPDLLSSEGIRFILKALDDVEADSGIAVICLRILKFACTAHEANKVTMVKCNGVETILTCAERFESNLSVVREACRALRTLTLNDDIRAQFGNAHDRTKEIVTKHRGLSRIFVLIKGHENDAALASEICGTLSKMLGRSEFCQQALDMGALEVIVDLLKAHMANPILVKKCIGLMKAMSGNDDVKFTVMKTEAPQLIVMALREHIDSPSVCEMVFAAVQVLCLRTPPHSNQIMELDFAALLIQAMNQHSNSPKLLRAASHAVRNLVARARHHRTTFLDLNIEALIRKAMVQHGKAVETESKAALRDLDLKVSLATPWMGKGGKAFKRAFDRRNNQDLDRSAECY